MKKIVLLVFLSFAYSRLNAQVINKLSLELNIARYSKEPGLFRSAYYSNELSYLNGFNIGYCASEKWQYYVGARKLNMPFESGGGFSLETAHIKGVELKIGAKYTYRPDRRLFLIYGLELFEELSKLRGTYWVDHPPTYEINHKKNYFGIAPILTINLKLADGIFVFADTRYRVGHVNLHQIESTEPDNELYPKKSYWSGIFEPFNAVGLRFRFD